MSVYARLNRNALAYCDLLHEQRRRFIMTIDEILQMARQIRLNRRLYDFYIRAGVEYLINPDTDELHRVGRGYFGGPHNLKTAHLENFTPCNNVGCLQVHRLPQDKKVPVVEFFSNKLIWYQLDKCEYCFPPLFRRGDSAARR